MGSLIPHGSNAPRCRPMRGDSLVAGLQPKTIPAFKGSLFPKQGFNLGQK